MKAYILAGGKSSRMGEDKGLMKIETKTMVQVVIDTLSLIFDEVVVVSNNQLYQDLLLNNTVIKDAILDKGPLGGIYTSLDHAKEDIFIISCDMPFVEADMCEIMFNEYDKNSDVLLFKIENKAQPLFGIYSINAIDYIKRALDDNRLKMMKLLDGLNVKYLYLEDVKYDEVFRNINTREDYNKIVE